jgi:hypothetical protein
MRRSTIRIAKLKRLNKDKSILFFGRMLFCKKIGKNFRKVVDFFVERGYNTQNPKRRATLGCA